MARPKILEGTGEELQRHLQQHPTERFRLVPMANGTALEELEASTRPEAISPQEEERLLDELAALGKHLPTSASGETYSREMIYADHN